MNVGLTSEMLSEAQITHEIFYISNGVAIQFLRETVRIHPADFPGLVLMDVNMPKLSEHAVTAPILPDPVLTNIPISGSRKPMP